MYVLVPILLRDYFAYKAYYVMQNIFESSIAYLKWNYTYVL